MVRRRCGIETPLHLSRDVRFTPKSGRVQCNSACPLCANSGHRACEPPKNKQATHRGAPNLFFPFSLFYSFLCHINTGGNVPPAVTVLDILVACNRIGRGQRHPITFGGLLVIPTRLRHRFFLIAGLRRRRRQPRWSLLPPAAGTPKTSQLALGSWRLQANIQQRR